MWSDNESVTDQLGFKTHAELIYQLVTDDSILPVTIGVFGDWGSGKSSIMRMLEDELLNCEDTVCLYFNGWVFEGYDDAKAALMHSILDKFKDRDTLPEKAKNKLSKLLNSVKWFRLAGLAFKNIVLPAVSTYFGGIETGALALMLQHQPGYTVSDPTKALNALTDIFKNADEDKIASLLREAEEEKTRLIRDFRKDFEEFVEEADIKRLVVLIDDLDRCSPERLIENLEAIKLFLNVPRTAFVISADPRIVQHAIEFRYKSRLTADEPMDADARTESLSKRFVKDYLEKLIQIPYHLPKLSEPEVETYLTLLFCQKHLKKDTYERVINTFLEFRNQNRYQVFGFSELKGDLEQLEQDAVNKDASLIIALAPLITKGLKGNPRQIKRFLNSYTLRSKLADVARMNSFRMEILAKLMILEYSELNLFQKLYDWQVSQEGEPKEIVDLEQFAKNDNVEEIRKSYQPAEWSSRAVVEWLNMEPKLTDVDLRDYYWLSRDHLLGSISGSSLIPQHLKALFSELITFGSESILNDIIKPKYMALPESEQDEVLRLLENEIIKRPKEDKTHIVFYALIGENLPNALDSYKAAISRVADHNEISFSLHNNIVKVSRNYSNILSLKKHFKEDSKIGRAFHIESEKPKK